MEWNLLYQTLLILCFTAATSLFCVFGSTMKCFGIFFNSFVEEFGASSSITALIPGILQGTYSTFSKYFILDMLFYTMNLSVPIKMKETYLVIEKASAMKTISS